MSETRQIVTPEQAARLAEYFAGLTLPVTVIIKKGKIRTNEQNALLHKWYGEIARQLGDRDAIQVKGECHHAFALPIKRRDPQFNWIWQRTGEGLAYEQQCRLLASGVLNVSSTMTVPELSEYMDAMSRHYRAEGVKLTDPEEQFDEPFEKAALRAKVGAPY